MISQNHRNILNYIAVYLSRFHRRRFPIRRERATVTEHVNNSYLICLFQRGMYPRGFLFSPDVPVMDFFLISKHEDARETRQ